MLKIKSILILTSGLGDYINLETDLPVGLIRNPGEQATFAHRVDSGKGEDYVKRHFPGVEYRVVIV